jgi:hypothetical protein
MAIFDGRGRRRLLMGGATAVSLLVWPFVAPMPGVDQLVSAAVSDQVAERVACPDGPRPQVKLGGGRAVPQLLADRLDQVDVSVRRVRLGTFGTGDLTTTLHDVRGLRDVAPRAGAVDAAVTVAYADLPVPVGGARPTFARTDDGSLTVTLGATGATGATGVDATAYLAVKLSGETITVVPRTIRVFGRTVTAQQARSVVGGARTIALPHLPAGIRYSDLTVRPDGVRLTIGGVSTTPLTALPRTSGSLALAYQVGGGKLGVGTTVTLPAMGAVPLVVWTRPRISGHTLAFVPTSVDVLGADRPPSDAIAALVLSQISPSDLQVTLPELPAGVRYRGVSVGRSGVSVSIGGTTLRPFSSLADAAGTGRGVTYGSEGGLLTATTSGAGAAAGTGALTATVRLRPQLVGSTLDLSPQTVEVLGVSFPAADVLARVPDVTTKYALPALGGGLRYTGIDVLDSSLRLHVAGKQVSLDRSALGAGCGTA